MAKQQPYDEAKAKRQCVKHIVDDVLVSNKKEWYNMQHAKLALMELNNHALQRTVRARELHDLRLRVSRSSDLTHSQQFIPLIDEALKIIVRADLCNEWLKKFESLITWEEDAPAGARKTSMSQTKTATPTVYGSQHVNYYRKRFAHLHEVIYGRRYVKSLVKDGVLHAREWCHNAHHGSGGDEHPSEFNRMLALQSAPKELRVVLCAGIYHDIDMENAYCMIAIYLGNKYGCDLQTLRRYTESKQAREAMLARVIDTYNLKAKFRDTARDVAKRVFLMMLHGAPRKQWLKKYGLNQHQNDEEIDEFAKEMSLLCCSMRESNRTIERSIFSNRKLFHDVTEREDVHKSDNSMTRLEQTMMSHVMSTYENQILSIIERYGEKNGWAVGSLQYDGLYVQHRDDESIDSFMRGAEREIVNETSENGQQGICIRLEEKPLYDRTQDWIIEHWRRAANANIVSLALCKASV
jgi:hypothetical protein